MQEYEYASHMEPEDNETDSTALSVLKENFTWDRGVIRPKDGHNPSREEMAAVSYLCNEWDYCWEPD